MPPTSQDVALKDYSDNEAVRSRGQGLTVSTLPGTRPGTRQVRIIFHFSVPKIRMYFCHVRV